MIDELLSRIQQYEIRVRKAYERQNTNLFGHVDVDREEDELTDVNQEEDDSIESDADAEDDTSNQTLQVPFVYPYTYEPKTDTAKYDRD